MDTPEWIPDSRISAYDSVRDAASGVMAWDAPARASDVQAALSAVSQEGVRSGVPGGPAVCGGVVAAAQ